MGISLTEPGLIPFEDTRREVETARELGAVIATHTACIWGHAQRAGPVRRTTGCSGPTSCTCTATPAPSATGRCCSAPTRRSRSRRRPRCRWAWATRRSARRSSAGLVLSLSCDVVSSNSGDMFSQMRLGLQDARALENDRSHRRRSDPTELAFTTRDALTWATVNGARALGAEDRLGSLTPGKQADVIVVGPGDGPPEHARARGTGRRRSCSRRTPPTSQAVLVAGRPVKLDGRLLDVDLARVRDMLDSSREGVLERTLADGPLLPEVKPSLRRPRARAAAEPERAGAGRLSRARAPEPPRARAGTRAEPRWPRPGGSGSRRGSRPRCATTPEQPDRPAHSCSASAISIDMSAVPWITSAGQSISPRRSVMSSRSNRQSAGACMLSRRERSPLLDPHRVELRVADDQVRDRLRRARPPARPRARSAASGDRPAAARGSSTPAWVSIKTSARTRSGAVSAARSDRKPPCDIPPTTARSIPRWSSSARQSARRVPVGERLAVELGLAEPALVPGDHPELGGQGLHLRREHLAVHQEAVREDHRRAIAAAVLIPDALTVDLRERHVPPRVRSTGSRSVGCPRTPARAHTGSLVEGRTLRACPQSRRDARGRREHAFGHRRLVAIVDPDGADARLDAPLGVRDGGRTPVAPASSSPAE